MGAKFKYFHFVCSLKNNNLEQHYWDWHKVKTTEEAIAEFKENFKNKIDTDKEVKCSISSYMEEDEFINKQQNLLNDWLSKHPEVVEKMKEEERQKKDSRKRALSDALSLVNAFQSMVPVDYFDYLYKPLRFSHCERNKYDKEIVKREKCFRTEFNEDSLNNEYLH